jgi:hypothetical protein
VPIARIFILTSWPVTHSLVAAFCLDTGLASRSLSQVPPGPTAGRKDTRWFLVESPHITGHVRLR